MATCFHGSVWGRQGKQDFPLVGLRLKGSGATASGWMYIMNISNQTISNEFMVYISWLNIWLDIKFNRGPQEWACWSHWVCSRMGFTYLSDLSDLSVKLVKSVKPQHVDVSFILMYLSLCWGISAFQQSPPFLGQNIWRPRNFQVITKATSW